MLTPASLLHDLETLPPSLHYLCFSLCAIHALLTPQPQLTLSPNPPHPPHPPHLSSLFYTLAYLVSLVRDNAISGTELEKEEYVQQAMKIVVSQIYSITPLQDHAVERVFSRPETDFRLLRVSEDLSLPLPGPGVPPRLYPDHVLGILSSRDGNPR